MSEQKLMDIMKNENLVIIQAITHILEKEPEEFVFSCGEWGKHWIKIIYKKGKKLKIKTRDEKNE